MARLAIAFWRKEQWHKRLQREISRVPESSDQGPIRRDVVLQPTITGITAKSADSVCLLDDDLSILKATGRLLASAGWRVETFTDPDDFLHHAATYRPRVVVIDMWMPRMHGLEVQGRLSEVSPSTRVIVLSANDDRVVRWKALAAGAAAFFIKHECDDEFLAGVRSAFAAQ
jgi:FixJ family two-component response regulator